VTPLVISYRTLPFCYPHGFKLGLSFDLARVHLSHIVTVTKGTLSDNN